VFFDEQREHLQHLGYDRAFVVAPNGVRVPRDRRWDGGSGGYIAYLGRFDPEHKGLDLLVQATALLPPDERPQLRLHGPDWRGGKDRVRDLVRELDLASDVVLGPPLYGDDKWGCWNVRSASCTRRGGRASGTRSPKRRPWVSRRSRRPTRSPPTSPHVAAAWSSTPSRMPSRRGCASWVRPGAVQPPTAEASVEQALGWDTVAHQWLVQLEALCPREGARRG
jgi:hypothetical protein